MGLSKVEQRIKQKERVQELGAAAVARRLVKPHIDSFDYFVEHGLQQSALGIRPIELFQSATNCRLRIWIERPSISPPLKDDRDKTQFLDQRLRPLECRQSGITYKGQFSADICYQWNDQAVMRFSTSFGQVPVMVKSSICHLRGADRNKLIACKEEASEAGGYFICNGNERIIRMLLVTKRNHVVAIRRNSYKNRGPAYTDIACLIRCVRPDQSSVTVRVYYMQYGGATLAFSYRRQEFLIPVGIILKALSHTQDREIFELLSSIYDENNSGKRGAVGTQLVVQRAQIILEEVRRVGLFTRLQCLEYIGERFRAILEGVEDQPAAAVGERVIEDHIFVHLETSLDKFHLLIFMLQKLFAVADHTAAPDNVDAIQHQEILLPGHVLTMYAKDRMQDWLGKVRRVLAKELEDKPNEFDLQDVKKVQKLMDKVPSTSIGKRFEYLLNTGNLASKHSLELMQSTGYTIVAERLNYLRYISHFRSVHRGAYFQSLRTTTVRKLLPESWGFLCPVHTPDGTPCGLLNHLTVSCEITSDMEANGVLRDYLSMRKEIVSVLSSYGMVSVSPGLAHCAPPSHVPVLLDGRVVGYVEASRIVSVVMGIRLLKVLRSSDIPADLEVAYVPCTFAGPYPGLFLSIGPARMVRPVKQLFGEQSVEMIGPLEQVYMDISCPDGIDNGWEDVSPTHMEISPMAMLSIVAGLTPWSDHNQSPRNMYQCQMGKQTMGFPAQTIQYRADNKLYRLQTPQTPLARTLRHTEYHMDEFPTGTNAIVAVLSYTGYDMEDAMIINKSSMERGLCHGQIYKTETIDLSRLNKKADGFNNKFARHTQLMYHSHAKFLDIDGLPYVGQRLKGDDPYCSVLNTMTGRAKVFKVKNSETAVVDYVAAVGTGPKEPLQKVTIRLRQERNPVIGDKFSSRHGQKGICSQLWPDIDMPFSHVTGMRPDIIINPHAFPSRMTIGMLLESMAAKGGALEGKFVDATPFKYNLSSSSDRDSVAREQKGGTLIDEYGDILRAHGFNYHGTEVMYSGVFGTELVCEIFIGVVYYQRLRHMVSDKFQVRSRGPVNPVTQQPVKGRSAGGGIRFGEMERDSLLAHGAAYLLHDRMHTCSDYHIGSVCSNCGSLIAPMAVSQAKAGHTHLLAVGAKRNKEVCRYCNSGKWIEKVAMPFAFRYLTSELAAMNVKLNLKVSDELRNT
ncbi:hypothetical protein KP509_26G071000 [Ceratopteris richardii]|uniref:DNA-directed RNA polymerase subunit beta n=4 Tax=Ceratopteris richardii TaxID=49495 RepID=A0A8T2RN92_CERRI|nr:hypothetical protein KP509_26G071000 [Ceratopteris richardii]